MAVFPPGEITSLGAQTMIEGVVPEIAFKGTNGNIFHLSGGMAPTPGVQNGVALKMIGGIQPGFDLLDLEGARQDGTTNMGNVFNPAHIQMTLEATGKTPAEFRKVVRTWISEWTPPNVGTLSWFTRELGEWWMPVRQFRVLPDQLQTTPALHRRQVFNWSARGDNSFWQGVDSTSQFKTSDGEGFNKVTNLGSRPVWPRHLVVGPGTFTIGDGPSTERNSSEVTFGPLHAGQRALISTLPRLRSVIDLSVSAPNSLKSHPLRTIISKLVDFATNNNTPPLLEYFESIFGTLPPQGPLYSLLDGRFQNPVMGKADGQPPKATDIRVGIEGGDSNSRIITAITPLRTYPE